ncbi:MAG: STAS domain-containing protein [Alphaproteobacteria bacterium]|nr:STAS domain-containing protein [Alphaproteobacteria bacterium]MDD9920506.1 STAS domain-containing protein [Alphaproteobacteria bacterium]
MLTVTEPVSGEFELKFDKTFDFESHKEFRQHIKDIMDKNPQRLSLNFADVEYLDSSALGMLMLAKHEADAKSAQIVITQLKEGHARKVLELVKFDQLFAIEYA